MKITKIWMGLLAIIALTYPMVSAASNKELALGSDNAPVTLIEYGSLTCDFCIAFHRNVLPRVKKRYINGGAARFIFRHFPTSETAVHAAVAAQCAGDKYYKMLDELYASVAGWYQAEDRNGFFTQQASSIGLNAEKFRACLNEKKHFEDILNRQRIARKEHDVTGTPTFFINGKIVRGKQSFAEIKKLIDEAAAQASR